MVELPSCQREDGDLQLSQLLIGDQRIRPQRTAELSIEVVFLERLLPCPGFLHQQFDGLVAEQPDAYIRQVEMILLQLTKGLDGRLLEHLLQD